MDLKVIKNTEDCNNDDYCNILDYETYEEISKVDEAVLRLKGVI